MKRNFSVIVVTAVIIFSMWAMSLKSENRSLTKVETINPTKKDIYNYINASGRIKEGNRRNIYVNTPGKIVEIHVDIGEHVLVGDTLMEIMPISAENIKKDAISTGEMKIADFLANTGLEIDFNLTDVTMIEGKDKKIEIISPINGIITDINVKKDDYITPFLKLVSVSDFSNLYVSAKIPENYSYKISEQNSVKISADAFGNKSYSGKIEKISPVAKYIPSLTGNGETYIEAKISINKPSSLLRPGLTVNAKINSETKKDALTLPYDCILQDEKNREYVYLVKDGIAVKRYILTGDELENEVEIKNGIMPDDIIVFKPTGDELNNKHVMVN